MNFQIKLIQSSSWFWSVIPCLWWETRVQENLQQAIMKCLQGSLWFRGNSWSKILLSFWNSFFFKKKIFTIALLTICIGKKWDENLVWGWNRESHVWSCDLQQGLISNLQFLHTLLPCILLSIREWNERRETVWMEMKLFHLLHSSK